MRVGFNARLLAAADLRGWNRYTVNLLQQLQILGVELVLYTDRPIHPNHLQRMNISENAVRVGVVRPHVRWEQFWLPAQFRRDAVDLFHAPANFGLPLKSRVPRVLTLHDAIDAAYYVPRQSLKERLRVNALRSKLTHATSRLAADRVITVSPHARDDLIRWLGISASKIRVTAEAADPIFEAEVSGERRFDVRGRHSLSRPYFFYVGGWEGRKNVDFLVKGFAESGVREDGVELVLAGGKSSEVARLKDLAESLGVSDSVRALGWIDDADLPALYAEALALVYPSEYEGFGLQVCEAFAVGCPVLAARATCLPWVVGAGGETFSLDGTAELTLLMRRVARDPGFRAELARRAVERSKEFSWRKTAEATMEVYREILLR